MAFFEPRRDRVARHAKHAGEATQEGTLVIGSQNLVFAFFVIAISLGLLAQAAAAGSTPKPLLTVAGLAVLANLRTTAVITFHDPQFYNRSPP